MTVGAGDVDSDGAIDLAGGSTLTFGDGNVAIGTGSGSTKDKSIFMSGTSTLSFGDGTFSAEGSITTQGGSKITFGKRSEEHTSELQSLMRISYAVFCLTKKTTQHNYTKTPKQHNIAHQHHQRHNNYRTVANTE